MKPRKTWTKRAFYFATIVAMIGATGGFVLAAGLTSIPITQSAQWYSVSSSAVSAFPTAPTIQVSSVPSGVTICTSSPQALTGGATVNLEVAASSTVTCTAGDFAEEFTLTSSSTAAAGTYSMTQYTTYGTPPTSGTGTASVSITTTLASSGTVNIFVDYGSATPPTGGISSLNLIVQ